MDSLEPIYDFIGIGENGLDDADVVNIKELVKELFLFRNSLIYPHISHASFIDNLEINILAYENLINGIMKNSEDVFHLYSSYDIQFRIKVLLFSLFKDLVINKMLRFQTQDDISNSIDFILTEFKKGNVYKLVKENKIIKGVFDNGNGDLYLKSIIGTCFYNVSDAVNINALDVDLLTLTLANDKNNGLENGLMEDGTNDYYYYVSALLTLGETIYLTLSDNKDNLAVIKNNKALYSGLYPKTKLFRSIGYAINNIIKHLDRGE